MKIKAVLLSLLAAALLAGVAVLGQQAEPPGAQMARAAEKLLASLTAEQKKKIQFDFDSKERTNWFFVPLQDKNRKSTRKGVALEEMNAAQKKLAFELLAAGTSDDGKKKAITIMALESILHDLEKGRGSVRNPEWYFVTIFGTPSKTGKWGWRIEGHHLSLNYTISGGDVIAATPAFFGANPAVIKTGPKKGEAVLPAAENLARELFLALSEEQKKQAQRDKHFPEPQQASVAPKLGEPQGLAAAQMTGDQRRILMKLIEAYARRMQPQIARAQMEEVEKGGTDRIYFAWSGGTKPGQPHTYRVHGPTFVIEFLNTQSDASGNPANHIHSVWRRIGGDFGL